jgi:fluoride ion exporter CrcB/FEX
VLVGYTSYIATMVTIKISVGLYFARIVVEKWHFKFIYGVVGVNLVSSIAAFFYTIFRCGTNMDEYALQQIMGNCGALPLDTFMAYQIGKRNGTRLCSMSG